MENSSFVSDSEWNQYISESYAELYDILVQTQQDYHLTEHQFTPSSSGTLDLPSDFYKVRGVDKQIGSSWVEVREFNFKDRNRNNNTFQSVSAYAAGVKYRTLGNTLRFAPSEGATGTFRLWYVPLPAPLTSDTDVLTNIEPWDQYIVVDAARKALIKEESSTTQVEREKDDLTRRIRAMSGDRNHSEPETITDINKIDWWR